jgi:hypothetical protein
LTVIIAWYSGDANSASGAISDAVLRSWEIFSNLRYLKKPVELFVIPDIEHGTHQVELPIQQLASKETTVDWFDFWLNGHEDPDPTKADQYSTLAQTEGTSRGRYEGCRNKATKQRWHLAIHKYRRAKPF